MDVFIANQHVGELIIREKSSTFIYTDEWQKSGFPIAPSLPTNIKDHHVPGVHGIFTDAAPDRWGRKLIERKHEGGYVSEQDDVEGWEYVCLKLEIPQKASFNFLPINSSWHGKRVQTA